MGSLRLAVIRPWCLAPVLVLVALVVGLRAPVANATTPACPAAVGTAPAQTMPLVFEGNPAPSAPSVVSEASGYNQQGGTANVDYFGSAGTTSWAIQVQDSGGTWHNVYEYNGANGVLVELAVFLPVGPLRFQINGSGGNSFIRVTVAGPIVGDQLVANDLDALCGELDADQQAIDADTQDASNTAHGDSFLVFAAILGVFACHWILKHFFPSA